MAIQINRPPAETSERVTQLLEAAFPGASVAVRGQGGHFEIRVVSAEFEGKNSLARQRSILGVIKDLMKGERAPVHAVDRIEALTPEQAGD